MHRMNMSFNLNESLEPGDNVTYLVRAMWALRKTFRAVESQKVLKIFCTLLILAYFCTLLIL